MPRQHSQRKSIWVYIKLDGGGFASPTELDLRYALEDAVEENGIGESEGAGSGGGWMDFSFGVENMQDVETALAFLKNLLTQYKVPEEVVRINVVNRYDQICDDLPHFHPGDCLSYRFEDGEYGAALVLKQGNQPNPETGLSWQSGMPPAAQSDDQAAETLIGVLDYKHSVPPEAGVFEQRNWLIASHESRQGQPYLVWAHCFGGVDVEVVEHISLKEDDPSDCQFHLSWESVPEYFIREKYQGNKALNPYERIGDNAPDFQAGDCLSYCFEDGEYGAALVLHRSTEGINRNETLIGILDYKGVGHPPAEIFEQRKWLIDKSDWRRGQPYLVWAGYCWSPDCAGLEVEVIHRIALNGNDTMSCQLGLYWEDIPEYIIRQMN